MQIKFPQAQKNNFKDKSNPMCPVNGGIDDTEHLLLCNFFTEHGRGLAAGNNDIREAY